jgi:hypothetical protein
MKFACNQTEEFAGVQLEKQQFAHVFNICCNPLTDGDKRIILSAWSRQHMNFDAI